MQNKENYERAAYEKSVKFAQTQELPPKPEFLSRPQVQPALSWGNPISLGLDLEDPESLVGLHPAEIVVTRFNYQQEAVLSEVGYEAGQFFNELHRYESIPENFDLLVGKLSSWVSGTCIEHDPMTRLMSRNRVRNRVHADLLLDLYLSLPQLG